MNLSWAQWGEKMAVVKAIILMGGGIIVHSGLQSDQPAYGQCRITSSSYSPVST